MGSVTANRGLAVLGGEIKTPLTGYWSAELDIDTSEELSGAITFSDGATEFVGTIIRGEPYSGRHKVWIQGGAGKFGKELGAKPYKSTSVRLVLNDILAETGDVLADSSTRAVLDRQLAFWHRAPGPAFTAIKSLILDEAQANFRTLRDGSLWVGTDTFAAQEVEHEIVGRQDAIGLISIAPETLELEVGRAFQGVTITELVYTLTRDKLRAEVWHRLTPLHDALQRWLKQELRALLFAELYPSIAMKVGSSGLADVLPDNSGVPDPSKNPHPMAPHGQTGVMVRAGLPGVRLELGKPERCVVGFDIASPRAPFVAGFQKGSTKARIGNLLVIQNAMSFAIISVEFFPAGGSALDPSSGNGMAEAARAAAVLSGNAAFLAPIEFEIWETR